MTPRIVVATASRVLAQLRRDPRTVALLIGVPVALVTLVKWVFLGQPAVFQRVGVPVLGIVENMSWFECPHCGKPSTLFGTGGGERLAAELGLPLLARVPLHPLVLEAADRGQPIVVADPGSSAARALVGMAERLTSQPSVAGGG